MSRSGYDDEPDNLSYICWRGAVASAIRGKRGQAFLKEMLAALDALPKPELIVNELEKDGEVCALGAVGRARGLDMTDIDSNNSDMIAWKFAIPYTLACEIMYKNDQNYKASPRARYEHMRKWIIANLRARLKG